MAAEPSEQTTQVLASIAAGDRGAAEQLMPLVQDELRKLAGSYFQRESPGHTLQPTALVNEAFLKLVDQTRVDWQGRTHFFAVAAQAMRRILVDYARSKKRVKRGGEWQRVTFDEQVTLSPKRDEDLLALDDALEKLAKLDARQSKIVELRFFGGLTVAEVAKVLQVSERTVANEWRMIRAWLRQELSEDAES